MSSSFSNYRKASPPKSARAAKNLPSQNLRTDHSEYTEPISSNSSSNLADQIGTAFSLGHSCSKIAAAPSSVTTIQLKDSQTLPIQRQGYGVEDENKLMSEWYDSSAGMSSPDAPMSVPVSTPSSYSDSRAKPRQNSEVSNSTSSSMPATSISHGSSTTELEETLQQSLPENERHLLNSELSSGSGLLQQMDMIQVGSERIRYANRASANRRQILQSWNNGRLSSDTAERAAINARRHLEAQTRGKLPESARTLNDLAARRNMNRYGDPLGYRNPEHYRQKHPNATTNEIIRSSGRTNRVVTGSSLVGGVFGAFGGALAVQDFYDGWQGRRQVKLKGKDPDNYKVGHGWESVSLGSGLHATIRVEKNIFGQKRFYMINTYQIA